MSETKVLREFACPNCKSKKTVTEVALEELQAMGKIDEIPPSRLKAESLPLTQVSKAILTVPVITMWFNICAGCGFTYCTKVEMMDAPVQQVA